jgi:hypothetical protein
MRKKVEELKDHTDFFSNFQAVLLIVVKGNPIDNDGTVVDLLQASETPKEGRFP